MKLIDSCGWLEFILKGPRAETYRDYLLGEEILVPTVVMYEVYKVIARDLSEELAGQTAIQMKAKHVVPLTEGIALAAAEVALRHKVGMGDAIVYATAQTHDATLVTSDFHFADMPGVEFLGGEQQ